MEYVTFKESKDLVGTITKINDNEYLKYEYYRDGYSRDYYNVLRMDYNNGMENSEKIGFNYGYFGWNFIVGQYQVSPDMIIFKLKKIDDMDGRYTSTAYALYSISENKEIGFDDLRYSVSSIFNLDDQTILHLHATSLESVKGFLYNDNSVEFFIKLPSLELIPNAYSSLRDQVISVSNFDDIKQIIKEDIKAQEKAEKIMECMSPFVPSNPRAQMLLLEKIKK